MTGSLWISMQQIAQVLLYGTDLLIIGRVLGPAAVVPYFVTAKLMLVLANQPLMLIQTAGPGLSEVRAGQPPERVAEVSTALMQAMLMISGGIVCVVLVVNQSFVGWWVGSERFGGIALTAVLLAAMFLRHANTTLVYTLFAFGHDRRISITTLGDGLLTVATSVVLVLVMGPIGAAIGSVVGVSVVSLPGNLPALFRDTGITPTRMARSLWPWFWRFAVLATGASVVAASPVPTSLIFVVSVAAGGAIAYGLVMLPLAVRDPLGIYVRPRWETLKTRLSWS
jgi:O-antigen/teichoic acid export membrane protein